jgi:hypothetical protein
MSRRVRPWFATAMLVVLSVLALGSCEFPGFLGDAFDVEGTLYWDDSGTLKAYDGKDAIVPFSMSTSGSPIPVFVGTLTAGNVNVHLGTPGASTLKSWTEILPITPTVSDSSALACVINTIGTDASSDPISNRNLSATTYIFWAYSDKNVALTVSGPTTGPGGVSVNMAMDVELKKGWNLIILTRTGTTEPYTDTYSIGDLPADVKLIWEGSPK